MIDIDIVYIQIQTHRYCKHHCKCKSVSSICVQQLAVRCCAAHARSSQLSSSPDSSARTRPAARTGAQRRLVIRSD